MTAKRISWYARSLCSALVLGMVIVLSACSVGLPGGIGSSATATPAPTSAPTTPPVQPTATPTTQPPPATQPTSTNFPQKVFDVNLITNGNAEAGPGTNNEINIEPIPGWTRHGSIDVIQYASTSGNYLAVSDSGPADRGKNYFYGGGDGIGNYGDNITTSITQSINLAPFAPILAQKPVHFTLSAWLGGYGGQDDNAKLTVQFLAADGHALGSANLGPVLAAERKNQDGLIQHSTTGTVPTGTMTIMVTLTMTKLAGGDNDGSADYLSLMFQP